MWIEPKSHVSTDLQIVEAIRSRSISGMRRSGEVVSTFSDVSVAPIPGAQP